MIIGICGLIGSGKGTVADILVENHNFEKLSFADKLKDGVADGSICRYTMRSIDR